MLASAIAPDFVEIDDALAVANDALSPKKYQSTKTITGDILILRISALFCIFSHNYFFKIIF